MRSLRESIAVAIVMKRYLNINTEEIADDVIKEFEKRIDSNKYKLFKDNNIVIPNGEDNTEYQKGYAHGIIDLKEELLK